MSSYLLNSFGSFGTGTATTPNAMALWDGGTVATGSGTVTGWASSEDPNSTGNVNTTTGELEAAETGPHLILSTARFLSPGTGTTLMSPQVGGTTLFQARSLYRSAGGHAIHLLSAGVDELTSGDIVTLNLSTGSSNINRAALAIYPLKSSSNIGCCARGIAQSLTGNTAITNEFTTVPYNAGSNFSSSTGRYTVGTGEDGVYLIIGAARDEFGETGQNGCRLLINGSTFTGSNVFNIDLPSESIEENIQTNYAFVAKELTAGDYVQLYYEGNTTTAGDIHFSVIKIPNSIEDYTMSAFKSSTQTITTASVTEDLTNYTDVLDGAGAFNSTTGVWTCQKAGVYIIHAGMGAKQTGTPYSGSEQLQTQVDISGSFASRLTCASFHNGADNYSGGFNLLKFEVGDQAKVRFFGTNASSTAQNVWFTVTMLNEG